MVTMQMFWRARDALTKRNESTDSNPEEDLIEDPSDLPPEFQL